MKLDIQKFGGRGASSQKISITSLQKKEDNIRNKMIKLYNQYDGFYRSDKDEVLKARQKWYNYKKQADQLREKRLDKIINSKKEEPSTISNTSTRPFINGYGEATTREITSATYKRAQKRLEREISRWLNY